jgi:hypothetical protein
VKAPHNCPMWNTSTKIQPFILVLLAPRCPRLGIEFCALWPRGFSLRVHYENQSEDADQCNNKLAAAPEPTKTQVVIGSRAN